MTEVKCPICKTVVDKRGLHQHKGSDECRVAKAKRTMKEEGYVRIHNKGVQKRVKERGGSIKRSKVFKKEKNRWGGYDKTITTASYAKKDLVQGIVEDYLSGHTTAKDKDAYQIFERTAYDHPWLIAEPANNNNSKYYFIIVERYKAKRKRKFIKRNYKTDYSLSDYFDEKELITVSRFFDDEEKFNKYIKKLNGILYNLDGQRVGEKADPDDDPEELIADNTLEKI